MTKEFCDICGKEITNFSDDCVSEFKLKKRVYSWHESWWERMIVHTSCWVDLCDILKKKAEEHDPNNQ